MMADRRSWRDTLADHWQDGLGILSWLGGLGFLATRRDMVIDGLRTTEAYRWTLVAGLLVSVLGGLLIAGWRQRQWPKDREYLQGIYWDRLSRRQQARSPFCAACWEESKRWHMMFSVRPEGTSLGAPFRYYFDSQHGHKRVELAGRDLLEGLFGAAPVPQAGRSVNGHQEPRVSDQ